VNAKNKSKPKEQYKLNLIYTTGYNIIMHELFEFNESAFKHGFTRADAINAFDNFMFKGPMIKEDRGKNLIIGFSTNLEIIEVIYQIEVSGTNRIFHIMECKKYYLDRYLGGK
jgi:hypothetical protein